MKNIVKLLIVFIALITLVNCAWVDSETIIRKDKNGKVIESFYTRKVTGFSSDKESAQTWSSSDQIARTKISNNVIYGKVVYLKIQNTTKNYTAQILNPPFKGLELGPGEISDQIKPFPVGLYPLTYHWCNIGSNTCDTKTVNIHIGENRTKPITIGW